MSKVKMGVTWAGACIGMLISMVVELLPKADYLVRRVRVQYETDYIKPIRAWKAK